MKILLLTWDFPPTRGGIQTWMAQVAQCLPDVDVRVLAPSVPGDRAFDVTLGSRVTRLGAARIGRVAWLAELCWRTLIGSIVWRPDLVVCGHVTTTPAALVASLVLRVPYVVFVYGYEIRRRRLIISFLLRRARLVLACSGFTRSAALEHGVAPDRARVIYPGVDPNRFAPAQTPVAADRPSTILTVSRLADMHKGHDTAIRALPFIKAKCRGVRYVIAGDGILRGYLRRVAQSVGVEGDVEFIGDVPDADLPRLYRSCDVVVVPSREIPDGGAEGFGIVCLEAAASGKPVVAGRSGGLPDAVQDGATGILVEPHDIGGFAEAIVAVLSDAALAERLGAAGRAMVLERFNWDHMARTARQLFAEAASFAGSPN